MGTSHQKIVAELYEAFARRDVRAITEIVDPEVEIQQTTLLPWGGTYHGHAGLMAFFTKLLGHVDSRVDADAFIDAGDHVVVIGHTRGKVRASGKEFDVRIAHVWTLKDGKARRFEAYIDTPAMLEALGG